MPEWRDLREEFGPIVWATVYRILGNLAEAEDGHRDHRGRAENGRPARMGVFQRLYLRHSARQIRADAILAEQAALSLIAVARRASSRRSRTPASERDRTASRRSCR